MKRALKWNEEWKDIGAPAHITLTRQELITQAWWLLIEQLLSGADDSSHTQSISKVRYDFKVIHVSLVDYYLAAYNLACVICDRRVSVHNGPQEWLLWIKYWFDIQYISISSQCILIQPAPCYTIQLALCILLDNVFYDNIFCYELIHIYLEVTCVFSIIIFFLKQTILIHIHELCAKYKTYLFTGSMS